MRLGRSCEHNGASLESALAELQQRVGPFRLISLLEQGLGVSLWAGKRDDGTQREPAVATLRVADDPQDSQAIAALRAEYEVLRLVEDPRVPAPLAFYAGQGALALAQRPGLSLKVLLLDVGQDVIPMSPSSALDIALEIAHAVRSVHGVMPDSGERIAHGHLTPGRVWLTRDGQVQLLGVGARLETPARCLPPERLGGGPVNALGDQWQQAAMLFEMVTLEPLFGVGERPSVSARLEGLDRAYPALSRVLHRALADAPQDRYPVDREWIRALHALLRASPGVSRRKELLPMLLAARKQPSPAPAPRPVERVTELQVKRAPEQPTAPGLRLTPPAAELPRPPDASGWEEFQPPLDQAPLSQPERAPPLQSEGPSVVEERAPAASPAPAEPARTPLETVVRVTLGALVALLVLLLIRAMF